jgi:hypothetical protein
MNVSDGRRKVAGPAIGRTGPEGGSSLGSLLRFVPATPAARSCHLPGTGEHGARARGILVGRSEANPQPHQARDLTRSRHKSGAILHGISGADHAVTPGEQFAVSKVGGTAAVQPINTTAANAKAELRRHPGIGAAGNMGAAMYSINSHW